MMPAYHQILFDGNLVTLVMRGFKSVIIVSDSHCEYVAIINFQKKIVKKAALSSDFKGKISKDLSHRRLL